MNKFAHRERHSLKASWLGRDRVERFDQERTSAYRIISTADGWVERLGDDLLISYKDETARSVLVTGALEWSEGAGRPAQRVFGKLLPRQNAERVKPILISGDPSLPLTTVVQENGVYYGLDFGAGYSAGLFLDQRANRAFLRARSPRRLLNTFAYTCSFSVVAALVGAETVSVDLSKKSLDRGRANFELNAIGLEGQRFIADDVMEVLPRLERRGDKFDCIVLDPPTFSRAESGNRFQVERDFEALLTAAFEVAAPHASLLLSTNCTRLDVRALEAIARHCLKLTRRSGRFHREPPLVDIPREFAATTMWIVL